MYENVVREVHEPQRRASRIELIHAELRGPLLGARPQVVVAGRQAHSVALMCIVEQHEASSEHETGRTRDWTTWDSPQRFSSLPTPLRE